MKNIFNKLSKKLHEFKEAFMKKWRNTEDSYLNTKKLIVVLILCFYSLSLIVVCISRIVSENPGWAWVGLQYFFLLLQFVCLFAMFSGGDDNRLFKYLHRFCSKEAWSNSLNITLSFQMIWAIAALITILASFSVSILFQALSLYYAFRFMNRLAYGNKQLKKRN